MSALAGARQTVWERQYIQDVFANTAELRLSTFKQCTNPPGFGAMSEQKLGILASDIYH